MFQLCVYIYMYIYIYILFVYLNNNCCCYKHTKCLLKINANITQRRPGDLGDTQFTKVFGEDILRLRAIKLLHTQILVLDKITALVVKQNTHNAHNLLKYSIV